MRSTLTLAISLAAALAAACTASDDQGAEAERTASLLAELPPAFAGADPSRGRSLYTNCSACHTLAEGGAHLAGPNLFGLFGEAAATRADFNYSEALRGADLTWDAEGLDRWLADPQAMVPGTRMVYVGMNDPRQRADLIAYLKIATTPSSR